MGRSQYICNSWQIRNAASRFAARAGAGIVEVILDLETLLQGQQAIAARVESTVGQYASRIKLAILDHITSSPTVHMPVKDIAAVCQRHGINGKLLNDLPLCLPAGVTAHNQTSKACVLPDQQVAEGQGTLHKCCLLPVLVPTKRGLHTLICRACSLAVTQNLLGFV